MRGRFERVTGGKKRCREVKENVGRLTVSE